MKSTVNILLVITLSAILNASRCVGHINKRTKKQQIKNEAISLTIKKIHTSADKYTYSLDVNIPLSLEDGNYQLTSTNQSIQLIQNNDPLQTTPLHQGVTISPSQQGLQRDVEPNNIAVYTLKLQYTITPEEKEANEDTVIKIDLIYQADKQIQATITLSISIDEKPTARTELENLAEAKLKEKNVIETKLKEMTEEENRIKNQLRRAKEIQAEAEADVQDIYSDPFSFLGNKAAIAKKVEDAAKARKNVAKLEQELQDQQSSIEELNKQITIIQKAIESVENLLNLRWESETEPAG
jgi:hypothetical protein